MKRASNLAFARRARLLAWLRQQPEFPNLPGHAEDVTDAARAALHAVAQRMLAEQLMGKTSTQEQRAWCIRTLVTEARTGLWDGGIGAG